jgi:CHASE1-domain containing sensor protein
MNKVFKCALTVVGLVTGFAAGAQSFSSSSAQNRNTNTSFASGSSTSASSTSAFASSSSFGSSQSNGHNWNGVTANAWVAAARPHPVSAVPEPETYAMMLAGVGLMGAVIRRRKNRG